MSISQTEMFKKCDELGEPKVREHINSGSWSDKRKLNHAQEWLRLKDEEKSLSLASIRDERENRTLLLAKEANRFASEANLIASNALSFIKRSRLADRTITIIAIIIAMIAARDDIKWLISLLIDKLLTS